MKGHKFLERSRPYLPHIGVLVAIIVLGAVLGMRDSSTDDARKVEPAQWRLPSVASQAAVSPEEVAATAAIFFDENAAKRQAAAPKPTEQTWKFVGTSRTGDRISAVITVPKSAAGPSVLRLQQGGKLPNGEQIVAVENGLMRYTNENGQQEVRAFARPRAANKESK